MRKKIGKNYSLRFETVEMLSILASLDLRTLSGEVDKLVADEFARRGMTLESEPSRLVDSGESYEEAS